MSEEDGTSIGIRLSSDGETEMVVTMPADRLLDMLADAHEVGRADERGEDAPEARQRVDELLARLGLDWVKAS